MVPGSPAGRRWCVVAKDIRIFRAGQGLYYVTYTGPLPKEEAIRIYRLVKISDSKLTPTLMSLGP